MSLDSAEKLGSVTQLTLDGRSAYPVFAPGDSIIYFERLLVSDAKDTTGRSVEELIKPYGIHVSSKELYTLSDQYDYPDKDSAAVKKPFKRAGEGVFGSMITPDSQIVFYETFIEGDEATHIIYMQRGDSTIQLTYGGLPCYLDRMSHNGRYVTIICGLNPSRIAIYDIIEEKGYLLDAKSNLMEYMTMFSSDDKSIAFVRSEGKYSIGFDFFGDIYIFRFN